MDVNPSNLSFFLLGQTDLPFNVPFAHAEVPPKSKKRVPYAPYEMESLIRCTREYGFGNWAVILKAGDFNRCRSSVDLKDKFRTMEKRGELPQDLLDMAAKVKRN